MTAVATKFPIQDVSHGLLGSLPSALLRRSLPSCSEDLQFLLPPFLFGRELNRISLDAARRRGVPPHVKRSFERAAEDLEPGAVTRPHRLQYMPPDLAGDRVERTAGRRRDARADLGDLFRLGKG